MGGRSLIAMPHTKYYYGCELVRVLDGDTIDVLADLGFDVSLKLRLRFAGINTDSIEFESHEGRGKFGRVLATPYVINGGVRTDVCQLLVREDHARLYDGGRREPWI
jgi:endonuclease YncB( thermonuclease family)